MLSNLRLSVSLLFLLFNSITLSAVTFRVTSPLDSGPGTLRQAILDANTVPLSEEVVVDLSPIQRDAGLRSPLIELTSGPLVIERPMAIETERRGRQVILRNPRRDSRLVTISGTIDGIVTIEGIHFIGGAQKTSPYSGGAIYYVQGGARTDPRYLILKISNCAFSENVAGVITGTTSAHGSGGAILFHGGNQAINPSVLEVSDTIFSANAVYSNATEGTPLAAGAAVHLDRAVARFDSVRFEEHTGNAGTASGGVIEFMGALPTSYFRHCIFENNVIGEGTSALRVTSRDGVPATLTIDRCLFANNGDDGSADAVIVIGLAGLWGAELDVVNSTFYGNRGNSSIRLSNYATVSLINCTITGNRHLGIGSAIRLFSQTSNLELTRTVIAGNTPITPSDLLSPDIDTGIGGTIFSGGYNFIGSGIGLEEFFTETGDVFGATNDDQLDPRLAPLGDYGGKIPTMPPLPDSPLVDAIDPNVSDAIPVDARDLPRPQGKLADIGAVELPRLRYNVWEEQLPEGERDGTADPDGDGLANSLEYFFGTDPAKPENHPVRWVTVDGETFVEFDRWTWVDPAYFSASRLAFSEDLQNWEPIVATPIVEGREAGSIDYFRYRFPVEPGTKSGFFRVEVE